MKDFVCICEFLVPIQTKTLVTILMHHRETVTTTNTGRITNFLLHNSEIHYKGLIQKPLEKENILKPGFTPLYLYPSDKAIELSPSYLSKIPGNIQLIVPDASWKQSKKFARRARFLQELPHVKLPNGIPSIFFLRRKIKETGVSTLEAIARALGIIESPQIQNHLETVFYTMVERTLNTRGKKLENLIASTKSLLA